MVDRTNARCFYSKYNQPSGFLSIFLSPGLRQRFSAPARSGVWIWFISFKRSRQEVRNDASTDNAGLRSPWQPLVSFGPSSPHSNIITEEILRHPGGEGCRVSLSCLSPQIHSPEVITVTSSLCVFLGKVKVRGWRTLSAKRRS